MVMWLAAAWRWFLGTALGRWIVGIGAVLAAVAALAAVAFLKGKHAQADADKAKDAVEQVKQAQAIQHAAQTRAEVESETAKMPDAPAQTVATADPATAAGKLRDDGWTRD